MHSLAWSFFSAAVLVAGAAGLSPAPPSMILAADNTPVTTVQKSGTEATLMGVHFRDAKMGWTVGAGGTILKTADGGRRWKASPSGTNAILAGVFFSDA